MKSVHVLPEVTLEGLELPAQLRLESVNLVQCLDAPAQCQLSWQAPTLAQSVQERTGVEIGAHFTLRIEGQPTALFSGEVTALEHRHGPSGEWQLWVRAYDPLIALQRQQTLDTHVDIETGALTRALAEGAGLATGEVASGGPVWPRVIPRFRHDVALLRHYCSRSALHFYFAEEALHLVRCRESTLEPKTLTLGENLVETRVEQNAARPVSEVTVLGWNSHTGEAHTGQGQVSATGSHRRLLGSVLESGSEADSLAGAEWLREQQASQVFWGVAEGDVALRPGRKVLLEGVATALAGPHWLTRVIHRVDAENGYWVELSSQLDPVETPESVPGLVLGEVSDVDDPDNRGRVQVTLPSYRDAVGTWMLVVQLGAGAGKGLITLPDVGDQVAVLVPEGDPSRGVVLGGVYDGEGPPHEAGGQGDDQHFPYTLTSRGGQRIQLSDENGGIRLQNAGGSYLALTPKGIVVHAAGDLTFEAPGNTIKLAGNRIDMRRE